MTRCRTPEPGRPRVAGRALAIFCLVLLAFSIDGSTDHLAFWPPLGANLTPAAQAGQGAALAPDAAEDAGPEAAEDAGPPKARVPEALAPAARAPARPKFRRAVLIRFEGEIHPLSENYLYRKLDEARNREADLVIVEFDSPGGHLQSSLDMAEKLRLLPWAHTVAYIPRQAYSGAAIAALGCDEIVMGPNAQFGDAAPIFQGPDAMFRHAPEKIRSVLVSQVRDLAEAHGRPPALAQAMVDMDVTVYRMEHRETGEVRFMSQQEIDAAGDLDEWQKGPPVLETQGDLFLTITGRRAVELQMAEAAVGDREELWNYLDLAEPPVVLESGALDTAVYVLNLPIVTGLLFVIGLIALYVELSAPGISVGGLVAGLCFALFFWSRFLGGTSTWLEIVLFAAGVIFVAVELFVLPGFGVAGVLGIVLMVASLLMASQDFVIPSTPREFNRLGTSLGVLVGAGVVFLVAAGFLSRHMGSIPIFSQLVLAPPGNSLADENAAAAGGEKPEETSGDQTVVRTASDVEQVVRVGDRGLVESPLRPAGKVRFGEEYIDVVADGAYVAAGRSVRVTRVRGNRIVVREVEPIG